ncbi:phosphoethanolamine transferase [Marinobacterium rhizophilum]|uniref:Phosphoethanolamine transferase n=1 Tax=Marinobacterium rhizophilum TaxID=420402 RepID=A0ABY5HQG4_9GAMM|nr:phosphoethanolamine transferase [Marinobacterium rhizophilum]UTW13803.1 phosphoethanolamine transferase [Marinobacterium rhizophilum]
MVRDRAWLTENLFGKRFVVNFVLSALAFWALLYCVRGLVRRRPLYGALLLLLLVAAYFAQASYFSVYGKFVTAFDFRFFAADPLLSLQLGAQTASLWHSVRVAVSVLLILALVMSLDARPSILRRCISGGLAVPLFLLITLNWYGTSSFQMAPVAYLGSLVSALEVQAQALDKPAKPLLASREARAGVPNIVVVIGESLNRDHLGLYGYARDTTPQLSAMLERGEMLAMQNAVGVSPRTLTSVPYMLTGLQGIDPKGVIYTVPTLFNYAKSGGYQTALISAQDFQWRNLDELFVDGDLDHYEQGVNFSADVSVSVGADDLQVLERGILPYMERVSEQEEPFMLVTQMSGSHTPFSDQVPQAYKIYLPEGGPNSVNAYDNTVRYADMYLSRLVEEARRIDPNTWVFYASDHGEHVSDQGSRFHADFIPEVIRNPLLVFPPLGQVGAVKAALDAPVSAADIVPSALELMGVEPVTELGGVSLLHPIDPERMRIVTAYMITLHNDPRAALVFPDQSIYDIDFKRGSVKLSDGETLIRYDELDSKYRGLFEPRLN